MIKANYIEKYNKHNSIVIVVRLVYFSFVLLLDVRSYSGTAALEGRTFRLQHAEWPQVTEIQSG